MTCSSTTPKKLERLIKKEKYNYLIYIFYTISLISIPNTKLRYKIGCIAFCFLLPNLFPLINSHIPTLEKSLIFYLGPVICFVRNITGNLLIMFSFLSRCLEFLTRGYMCVRVLGLGTCVTKQKKSLLRSRYIQQAGRIFFVRFPRLNVKLQFYIILPFVFLLRSNFFSAPFLIECHVL